MFWDSQKGEFQFSLALVTGATSGIGRALCILLASKNIPLIVHGRDTSKLNELAEDLAGKVKVEIVSGDLAFDADQQALAEVISTQKPDLVINNAGFGLYGPVLDFSTEEQLKILEVDGQAVVKLTIEAARTLIASSRLGVILNVSSAAAFVISPGFALYSAAKALVNQFSESFDEETKPQGVRVLAACPGVVKTNFRARAGGKDVTGGDAIAAMSPEFAAKEIWKQIQKGKKLHIFNWKYRASLFIARYLMPSKLVAKIMKNKIDQITSK